MIAPDQQPHPWRCETCENYIKEGSGKVCKLRIYNPWKPPYQPTIIAHHSVPIDAYYWFEKLGCASHHLARQNNPAAIAAAARAEERERVLDLLTSACSIRAFVDSDGDVHYGALTLGEIQDVLQIQPPTTGSTTSLEEQQDTEAWAIQEPDGKFLFVSFSRSEIIKINAATEEEWARAEDEGYRCIRVRIVPVEETVSPAKGKEGE